MVVRCPAVAARLSRLTLTALLAAGQAQAQDRIEPEPSPALGCLKVRDGAPDEPVYPFDAYKGGLSGKVRAQVTLPGGLFGNAVNIVAREGDDAFVEAARSYLRSLQAPCLKRGETATLSYEFIFRPDGRQVVWGMPSEVAEAKHQALRDCIRHERPGSAIVYPDRARREAVEGRVLAILTFSSAEGPPEIEFLNRAQTRVFLPGVRDWALGQRMPCHPGGEPIMLRQQFVFRLEGAGAYGFKPLTLRDVLAVTKGIRERGLVLDTTTMGCPFDVKVQYLQPLRRNVVGEVGASDPRRRPLLDFLAGAELQLREDMLDAVFADTADVAVPCLRIKLNPQEKTS
jgi:hypothetical protein